MKIWGWCYQYLLLVSVMWLLIFQLLTGMGEFFHQLPPEKNINENKKIEFSKRELMLYNLCGKYILQHLKHLQTKFTCSMTDWELTNVSAEQCLHRRSAILHILWHPPAATLQSEKMMGCLKKQCTGPISSLGFGLQFQIFLIVPCKCLLMHVNGSSSISLKKGLWRGYIPPDSLFWNPYHHSWELE